MSSIQTPAAVIDLARMDRNIERMRQRLHALGVSFRPHVKTAKCTQIAMAERAAGARGITVSTLGEAEHFFAVGFTDILYAVGMVPAKLGRALALRRQGCELKIVTDNLESANAIAAFAREHRESLEVLLEIDTDGHRAGIRADAGLLLEVARVLDAGGLRLGGVMTHAGSSYQCDTPEALRSIAEQERAGCVFAAERLRAAGLACPRVSVGSTPTALSATHLDGVTEVRSGVYVFFDLVMHNIGVCTTDEIAMSVLATVIGHHSATGAAIVDAGWMALSADRGTAQQKRDYAYGQVCLEDGTVLPGYLLSAVNQEHGIVGRDRVPGDAEEQGFPVGTRLRILPNHACATAAQFPAYQVLGPDGELVTWQRLQGW